MGIFGALTTAVTGMRAQSFALENISGNIANSQTTAFKRIDTSFQISSRTSSPQAARRQRDRQFAHHQHGAGRRSERLGRHLHGDQRRRLLRRAEAASFTDNRPVFDGVDLYTRRGDFQLDKNGYLVNGAGYYLMGIPIDPTTGNLVGSVPQLLQFQNDFLPAQATTQIDYRANLASYPLTPPMTPTCRVGIARSGKLLGQSNRGAPASPRSPARGDVVAGCAGRSDRNARSSALLGVAGTLDINGTTIAIAANDDRRRS